MSVTKLNKKSYFIVFFATIVRYYDYSLFGISAAAIASNFMPSASNSDKLLDFFMIFSFSVIAKPLGSIIFGRMADKIGRTYCFKITTIISASTVLILGILPQYQVIGVIAAAIVTICRMFFLMSLAGEVDTIKVYIAEKIGKKHRNLVSGLVSFFAQIGVLIAASMYSFTLSYNNDVAWLWRINFIIGGILGLIVFYLRSHLKESDYYNEKKNIHQEEFNLGTIKLVVKNSRKFLLALILSGGIGASYNFLIIFLGTFASNVVGIISPVEAAKNNVILIGTYAISCIVSGLWADKARSIYQQVFLALIAVLITISIAQLSIMHKFLFSCQLILVVFMPIYMIPLQIKLQSMFSVVARVRMYSLAHSLGSMIFSATIPFFCMLIWKYTENFSLVYGYFALIISMMILAASKLSYDNFENMFET